MRRRNSPRSWWTIGVSTDAAGAAEKTLQTYTKVNPQTGEVYVGRTSGTGSGSYAAVCGREQQLIEHYRELGISANKINGISPSNPPLQWYMESAFGEFGP